MNQYVTGSVIKHLREKHGMTQSTLAEKINVSDKTVSKWETGKGYPDITLLEPIARVFNISLTELLSGNIVSNANPSGNMLKSCFCVCPICGNIIHSMGQASVSCHGIELFPLEFEDNDGEHEILTKKVEDEYFVEVTHEMSKAHHISFIATISDNRVQIEKLYPEQDACARFKIDGIRYIYIYCNRNGLFRKKIY